MKKLEIIGILVLIILVVIWIISIINGLKTKTVNPAISTEIPCETLCLKTSQNEWRFRMQTFYSREDCLAECKTSRKQ